MLEIKWLFRAWSSAYGHSVLIGIGVAAEGSGIGVCSVGCGCGVWLAVGFGLGLDVGLEVGTGLVVGAGVDCGSTRPYARPKAAKATMVPQATQANTVLFASIVELYPYVAWATRVLRLGSLLRADVPNPL